MGEINIIKAESRGAMKMDWLDARYSFSFASYQDIARMHFGVLRVLNDDIIAHGGGFGMHHHDNMEIVTLPLEGALEHKDSLGNTGIIRKGEIQVMSAGSGILHSEYNHSQTQPVKLLQIWIYPLAKDVSPRYAQRAYDIGMIDKWQCLISPKSNENETWVHQDAWFSLGIIESNTVIDYVCKKPGNGLYIFLIDGRCTIEKHELNMRDAITITGVDQIKIAVSVKSTILVMDIPMQ